MLHRFLSGHWAMEPRLHDRLAPLVMSGRVDINSAKLARERRSPRFEVVDLSGPAPSAVGSGSAYKYLAKMGTKEGVVPIIPIIGTMSRYGDLCSYGTEDIAQWVLEAENDRSVVGMVLEIDSGGGK